MKTITLKKGLDIPITGAPEQRVRPGNEVRQVAVIGDDFPGLAPTLLVEVDERVVIGQPLLSHKKNPGVIITSPGCGRVAAVNRGAKRKFESLVIELHGEEAVTFTAPLSSPDRLEPLVIREILIDSGLWTAFRTRPYGKTPAIDSNPASLFITAMDTAPLAADPKVVMDKYRAEYRFGLQVLRYFLPVPIHYCTGSEKLARFEEVDGLQYWCFKGPHPAGLPSTHIHFIDPVHENKTVWHIGYQDVIAIGHLFTTGRLLTERIVALAGPGVLQPSLVKTRLGASLTDLCRREISLEELRVVSGSVLSGREAKGSVAFLGRFHDQVSVIEESSGRSFFSWLAPDPNRFSIRRLFPSSFGKKNGRRTLPMTTAMWGGRRAIFPLGTYEEVMPLDIVAMPLLKALAKGDTDKSKALGCLELIEDDLALCSLVCPGKNEFGESLREVLTAIEQGG